MGGAPERAGRGRGRPRDGSQAGGGGEGLAEHLLQAANDGVVAFELRDDGSLGPFVRVNRAMCGMLGRSAEELLGLGPLEVFDPTGLPRLGAVGRALLREGAFVHEATLMASDGSRIAAEASSRVFEHEGRRMVVSVVRDVTKRRRIEEDLRRSEERFRRLFDNMSEGCAIHELVYDERGRPADFRFLEVNPAFERMTGLGRAGTVGKTLLEVLPEAEALWIDAYAEVAETGVPARFEGRSGPLGRDYDVFAFSPVKGQFAALFVDVTDRNRARTDRRRHLTEIWRKASQLETVLETTHAQLALLDRSFDFVMVNSAYARAAGQEAEQLVGRNHFALFPDEENRSIFERVRETGEPYFVVEKPFGHPAKGRELTYWNWTLRPITDREGQVETLLLSLFDVTQQVRAREQVEEARRAAEVSAAQAAARAAELDAAINAMVDGVVLYDLDGRVLRLNATAERLFGSDGRIWRSPLDVTLERAGSKLADGSSLTASNAPTSRALRGESVDGELIVVETAAGRRWLSVSAAPVLAPDGSVRLGVAGFTDVTTMRELQEEREDLLRTISHDLRTPLGALLLQAQILQRSLGPEHAEARRVESVVTCGRQVSGMIRDLVEVARLESGQLHLEARPVEVDSFVLGVKERLTGTLEMGRVKLDLSPGLPTLKVDADRFERVLVNLLDNALKYSDGEVVLGADRDGSGVRISVFDHGCGIAEEDIPRLFARYFRASSARSKDGLGLGLYISSKLVEAHGGRIEVESAVGRGTTFRVVLPAGA